MSIGKPGIGVFHAEDGVMAFVLSRQNMEDLSGGRRVWSPCYQSSTRPPLRNFPEICHQCLCYELKCIPPKDMLKSSPSVPVTTILFGNGHVIWLGWGHTDLGWALIQYNWYPYEKKKDTDTQGECHVLMEAKIRVICLWAKECQGLLANTRS